MVQLQFIRSNTFRWAIAIAAALAIFIGLLFGFIYWKIHDYLIMRSDRMIAMQIEFFAAMSPERRLAAINDHLGEDSRNVQFAGLFDAKGSRLAGNLARVPDELSIDGPVTSARVARLDRKELGDPVVRAIARRLPNGDTLV